MRGTRVFVAAFGLTAVLCASACSSGANPADVNATATTFTGGDSTKAAPTNNPSAITSPSPGAVTSTDKSFNFVVPSGWNLTTNPKALAYLSSATVAHGVAPTIVVTKSDVSPAPALDDVVQMAMMQARQNNATTNKSATRTIGGEKAEGFTATSQDNGVAVQRMYYVVEHNGTAYTIALTSAQADQSSATSTLNSLLSSWTWSKPGDNNSTANGTTPAQSPTSTSSSTNASSSTASSTSAPSGATTKKETTPKATSTTPGIKKK